MNSGAPSFLGGAPVLVAEDSDDDVFLMKLACQRSGLRNPLVFAHDGEQVLERLADVERRPALVLLDLNLPKRGGMEILQWIRSTPRLKALPVYVLSASSRPLDVRRALEAGANAYLIKPSRLDSLIEMLTALKAFVRFHALPPSDAGPDRPHS